MSRSNKNAAKFQGSLKSGSGTTGQTFAAAIAVVALLLPVLVFLKNAAGLSQRDRARVVRELEKLGYLVIVMVSNLTQHGVPCRRLRVWFLAVLLPYASQAQKTAAQTAAQNFEILLRRRPL